MSNNYSVEVCFLDDVEGVITSMFQARSVVFRNGSLRVYVQDRSEPLIFGSHVLQGFHLIVL